MKEVKDKPLTAFDKMRLFEMAIDNMGLDIGLRVAKMKHPDRNLDDYKWRIFRQDVGKDWPEVWISGETINPSLNHTGWTFLLTEEDKSRMAELTGYPNTRRSLNERS